MQLKRPLKNMLLETLLQEVRCSTSQSPESMAHEIKIILNLNRIKDYFFTENRCVFVVRNVGLAYNFVHMEKLGLFDDWHTEIGQIGDGTSEVKAFIALSKDPTQLPSGENG